MQSPLWKLTALAGVIGVGVIVVVQAQKNIAERTRSAQEQFVELEKTGSESPESTSADGSAGLNDDGWSPAEVTGKPSVATLAGNGASAANETEDDFANAPATFPDAGDDRFTSLYEAVSGNSSPAMAAQSGDASVLVIPDTGSAARGGVQPVSFESTEPANLSAVPSFPVGDELGLPPAPIDVTGDEPRDEPNVFVPEPAGEMLASADPQEAKGGNDLLRPFPRELDAPTLIPPPTRTPNEEDVAWPEPQPDVAQALMQSGSEPAAVIPTSGADGEAIASSVPAPRDRTRSSIPNGAAESSIPPQPLSEDPFPVDLFNPEPAAASSGGSTGRSSIPGGATGELPGEPSNALDQSQPEMLFLPDSGSDESVTPPPRTREQPAAAPPAPPNSNSALPAFPESLPAFPESLPDPAASPQPIEDELPFALERTDPPSRGSGPTSAQPPAQIDEPYFPSDAPAGNNSSSGEMRPEAGDPFGAAPPLPPETALRSEPGTGVGVRSSIPANVDRSSIPEPQRSSIPAEAATGDRTRSSIPAGASEEAPGMAPAGGADPFVPLPEPPSEPVGRESMDSGFPDPPADAPVDPAESPFPDFPPLPEQPREVPDNAGTGVTDLPPFPGDSLPESLGETGESRPVQIDPGSLAGTGTLDGTTPAGPQQPELQIEKDAPPRAVLNEPLVYNIRVKNIGRSEAHQVVVEDSIPRGTILKGTIPEAELDPTDNHLIWRLGSMPPGSEKLIRVQVVPTEAGEIGSVATVRFVGRVAARTVITAPKVSLELTGPAEAVVGENSTYVFRITNEGDGDATGVVLRNFIPDLLEHPAGTDIEYDVGAIKAGESRTVELTVNAVKPGHATNTALITVNGTEHDRAATDVYVIASRLRVTRTGPQSRFVNRPANFQTEVANDSSQSLKNVVIQEMLAEGVELAAVPEHGRYDRVRRTITWVVPELPPQQSVTVKTALVTAVPGQYTCKLEARDGSGHQAEAVSMLQVEGFSSLKVNVAQTTQNGGAVAVGEEVALRLTIQNRGSAPATDVVTEFEIPPELEFVAARPETYSLNGGKIRFESIPRLEVDGQKVLEIVCVAKSDGTPRVAASIWSKDQPPVIQQEPVVVFRED